MSAVNNNEKWEKSEASVFWGEIAPGGHLVQIYENDEAVLDSLEGFALSGLKANEAVVVIATKDRLELLNARLWRAGFNLNNLQAIKQYIALDANDTLTKFMKSGWPDETLFTETIKEIIEQARGKTNRKVRAYGEMVALLWAKGYNGATVQLETLWNKFCELESLCLFCAYPKSGFTQDLNSSLNHICSAHTLMIGGFEKSKTEVFYKSTESRKVEVVRK